MQMHFVHGEIPEGLYGTYETVATDGTATAVDITGYTITMHIRHPNGTRTAKTATLDTPTDGEFHFEFASGDLVEGVSRVDILVADGSGNTAYWPSKGPIAFVVRPAA